MGESARQSWCLLSVLKLVFSGRNDSNYSCSFLVGKKCLCFCELIGRRGGGEGGRGGGKGGRGGGKGGRGEGGEGREGGKGGGRGRGGRGGGGEGGSGREGGRKGSEDSEWGKECIYNR